MAKLFNKTSPEQQLEWLRSLKQEVTCEAEHVMPDPGVGLVDVCRVEGP
eukprot:CAMPEP_0115118912 /NCGR_PEP_ID=MMETSP0227-20121206/44776_1 /TAXON_ID=89957 /ORGANISM="Polarella glacialis, Strain CCMP 1383" /LENGTH=48 /DNA_ID= /DNA_START= /DNA_END= /DNA_ORIENTATION=